MVLDTDFTTHKKMAIDLFNLTWDLIEKQDRTEAEADMMIYAANVSRYHMGCRRHTPEFRQRRMADFKSVCDS